MKIRKAKKNEKSVEQFRHREWWRFNREKGYQWDEKKYIFVASEKGKIIGFIKFTIAGGVGYLKQLITKKEVRKKGIGKRLMGKFEDIAKKKKCHLVYLKTSEDHKDAIKFYQGLNYKIVATLKNYEFGLKWYIMEKKLK